jgi:hypothetical protein
MPSDIVLEHADPIALTLSQSDRLIGVVASSETMSSES